MSLDGGQFLRVAKIKNGNGTNGNSKNGHWKKKR